MRETVGCINTPAQGDRLALTETGTEKLHTNTPTHTQKRCASPHLVTVKPLPSNMSIRRNTKKLTEKSNFPGERE